MEALQRVASDIFVVAPDAARFADLGLRVYPDRVSDAGALGGIHTALAVAGTEWVFTVACDMPFLDADLLGRLRTIAEGHDGAWVVSARGPEPLLACYRCTIASAIGNWLAAGHRRAATLDRLLDLAVLGPEELAAFGDPARLLANVNSPDDYARVQYDTA